LHRWGTEVWDWPRWKWFVLWRMCAAVWRLVTGKSVGSLVACPTRVREQGGSPGLGATRLYWVAIRTHALEVRVGGPVGPVFQHCPRVVGRAETGVWVHDRMLFFLQDVAGSRPVTLDVVRVRVATSGRIKKTVLGRAFEWLATKLDG